jgi:hypothetical protein
MGSYVDVSGIPSEFLEFMGYIILDEDDEFRLINHKGDHHILWKRGSQLLFVDDDNDVSIFRGRRRIPAPPKDGG